MKDYELQIRVKNNYLLTAMRENGYFSTPELARKSGVGLGTIYKMLALTDGAATRYGGIRPSVIKLAIFLQRDPAHLFPPQHFDRPLKNNKAVIQINLSEVERLFQEENATPLLLPDVAVEMADLRRVLGDVLGGLNPREQRVLELRNGLNGEDELTLKEVGERLFKEGITDHAITTTRILQIENKAMRKLSHPSRSDRLKEVCVWN